LFALVTSLLVPGLLLPLEEPIRAGLLPGAPTWFSAGLGQLTAYSESMQVATLALWFVAVVIVGPIVEEVYFRGYLLGELPGSALTRSLLGSVMFSLYHLWQPQAFLTMVATSLPLYWVVIRSGRLMPAVIAHVGANTLMFALLSFGVLSR
jgi:membrane protease YdiL (CAAX protease family)